MKKALITGITGQDGAYLAKLLLDKGYEVYGAFRRTSDLQLSRLRFLGIENEVKFVPMELLEITNLCRGIEKIEPDEIYNLGAQSFVALSFEEPIFTAEVTGVGVLRMLEAIRSVNPNIRFYQASSSEMFGHVQMTPQNEKTPFYPRSPYGFAKLFAHWATVNYRESYQLFACSGILFNHESPLRGFEFVTRKITDGVAKIKHGLQDKLTLGNLSAKRDWGYAPEYVEVMWRILQQPEPDDFVVATGENHTVREFLYHAFSRIGILLEFVGEGPDEKGINTSTGEVVIEVSKAFFRPAEVDTLLGDASKAKQKLGWRSETSFEALVSCMVDADCKRIADDCLLKHP